MQEVSASWEESGKAVPQDRRIGALSTGGPRARGVTWPQPRSRDPPPRGSLLESHAEGGRLGARIPVRPSRWLFPRVPPGPVGSGATASLRPLASALPGSDSWPSASEATADQRRSQPAGTEAWLGFRKEECRLPTRREKSRAGPHAHLRPRGKKSPRSPDPSRAGGLTP